MKKIGAVVGIAALLGVLYLGFGTRRAGLPAAGKGEVAPGAKTAAPSASAVSSRKPAAGFELKDLDGRTLSLAQSKGKVVLLDFWATWCPPCRAELPHFKQIYTQYKGKGLEIIGVSVDEGGEGVVRSFVRENDLRYPIALGNPKIVRDYGGIHGIPTTFLIDKQGRIAKKYVGYQDKAVFENEIQRLLSE